MTFSNHFLLNVVLLVIVWLYASHFNEIIMIFGNVCINSVLIHRLLFAQPCGSHRGLNTVYVLKETGLTEAEDTSDLVQQFCHSRGRTLKATSQARMGSRTPFKMKSGRCRKKQVVGGEKCVYKVCVCAWTAAKEGQERRVSWEMEWNCLLYQRWRKCFRNDQRSVFVAF